MQIFMDKSWCRFILVVMAVLLLTTAGCGNSDIDGDDGDGGADAPMVPPAYTLVPNFGELGNTESSASADETLADPMLKRQSGTDTGVSITAGCIIDNYAHASLNVGFWNLALTVTLAVPAWSFAEAFHHDPVLQEDGSWLWSYSATILSVLHTAELYGSLVDGEVHWDMYITKDGFYEDFPWYSGVSNLPATEGAWTIKKSPDDPSDWIVIDWSREVSNATWQVRYMNIQAGDDNEGGFIEYGIIDDDTYDAFYDIYNAAEENHVEIDAGTTSNEGRVRNPAHFGDEDWHYWDGNHCDSVAPAS